MPAKRSAIEAGDYLSGLEIEVDSEQTDGEEGLQSTLRSLMGEHGLIPILQALEVLVENQAVQFSEVSQSGDQVVQTLETTARSLHQLAESLPAELDIELALAQITHTAPVLESDLTLSNGSTV